MRAVYVSGYTNNESTGIYQYQFDQTTGILSRKGLVAKSTNPSFFICRNNNLYTVNEVGQYKGDKTGYVSCYYRNKETGELSLANEQPSGGEDPCHLTCDATGNYVLVANYTGGSASVFPILNSGKPESKLGERVSYTKHIDLFPPSGGNPTRQEKPHVHSIDLDPIAQRYAFTNDLGCDLLATYRFDRHDNGKLTRQDTFEFPKGSGPRHLKFAPNNNNICYVLTELSNDVHMLELNFETGSFNQVQIVHALPDDFSGENLGSEIDITPNGKFLYASMRGYDAITIFKIDEYSGKLNLVGYQGTGGKHPRHFTFDPTGSFILVGNKDSDNIVVFKIDQETGLLNQVSSIDHVQPTCIQFWE
ncbi:Lactonase, 7-bladed beta-propeller-domain-containing protein [Thamnidium elegans]|uniref:6-phosphogluconolactonase n=1 Tax=Thamnidium elegans TaxID=101142 RepID=A0A8H7VNC9_9FUNG|nr:hypothetical protein INT48_001511 [Thamnidium elegans]KAI8049314.1 Lactonase, 7-bladed beta-propeller-domain-containing protein [Thamnidium elegans]